MHAHTHTASKRILHGEPLYLRGTEAQCAGFSAAMVCCFTGGQYKLYDVYMWNRSPTGCCALFVQYVQYVGMLGLWYQYDDGDLKNQKSST